jgi:hypothetical protein
MNTLEFVKQQLSEEEIVKLRNIHSMSNRESRLVELKTFFNQPTIFNKIATVIDPMWLVNNLHNHYNEFEF